MPKKRVIAALTVRNGIVVQSIGFQRYLPVGRPEIAARFLDSWGIDELLLIDIAASAEKRLIDADLVHRVSREIYIPLTVGGGIRSLDDITLLLRSGADKVSLNRTIHEDSSLIGDAARMFGGQCVVASIDAKKTGAGYEVMLDGARTPTGEDPYDVARRYEHAGAGEILLTSIDCDGAKGGYDLDLIDRVGKNLTIPLICLGGAGHPGHISAALRRPFVSAAAVGNMLHYAEHSVALYKASLRSDGIDVRIDAMADYSHSSFDKSGRLEKLNDRELEAQVFEYVHEEAI